MSRTADIRVPHEVVEAAVRSLFASDAVLEAPSEADKRRDIDFVVRTANHSFSIDMKVRRGKHQRLVIEVDVLNTDKRPWLYASNADYFLFAHIDEKSQSANFYLVRRTDLQKLVKQKAPSARRAFVYDYKHVSILYFYDYEVLSEIGKLYKVTVSTRNLISNHASA